MKNRIFIFVLIAVFILTLNLQIFADDTNNPTPTIPPTGTNEPVGGTSSETSTTEPPKLEIPPVIENPPLPPVENRVIVNDKNEILIKDISILSKDELSFVPIKETLSLFDYKIDFDKSSNSILISKDTQSFTLPLNKRYFYSNINNIVFMKKNVLLKDNISYLDIETLEKILGKKVVYENNLLIVKNEPRSYILEPNKTVDSSNIFTLQELEESMYSWSSMYDFVTVKTIGKTVEGRDIFSVVVNYKPELQKSKILLMGGIHAREDYSVTLTAKMLDEMLYSLAKGQNIDQYNLDFLFTNAEVHVIPVINPDGLNIVHNGLQSSSNYEYLKTIKNVVNTKTMLNDYSLFKANANGVDLNGNFPDSSWAIKWNPKTSQKVPATEGYKGPSAGSESETQAIVKYCKENQFLLGVSYHTTGNLVYWADSKTHSIFKNLDTQITKGFLSLTGYSDPGISKIPAVYGSGFENWFREYFYRPAFCVELSPPSGGKQYSDEQFDALVWGKAKYTGLYFIQEALRSKDKMYDVYQNDTLLKTFYSKEDAIIFAKKWKDSKVMNKGTAIWVYDLNVVTFLKNMVLRFNS